MIERKRLMYAFRITNDGGGPAMDVDLTVTDQRGVSLLLRSDRREKLPVPILEPHEKREILADAGGESQVPFDANLAWKDPDGTERYREKNLFLP